MNTPHQTCPTKFYVRVGDPLKKLVSLVPNKLRKRVLCLKKRKRDVVKGNDTCQKNVAKIIDISKGQGTILQ